MTKALVLFTALCLIGFVLWFETGGDDTSSRSAPPPVALPSEPTGTFMDDFESELVFDVVTAWKQEQLVRGSIDRVPDPTDANNTVVRATAGERTLLGEVGKADLIRRSVPIPAGRDITVSARFYFPAGTARDSIHLFDVECGTCGIDTNPGPRLYLRDGRLRIDRGKIGIDESFYPNIEHEIQPDTWHTITWRVRGGESSDGFSEVMVDGETVLQATGTTILTQAVASRYGIELGGTHFDSIQIGLTANSNREPQTVYFDDVRIDIGR